MANMSFLSANFSIDTTEVWDRFTRDTTITILIAGIVFFLLAVFFIFAFPNDRSESPKGFIISIVAAVSLAAVAITSALYYWLNAQIVNDTLDNFEAHHDIEMFQQAGRDADSNEYERIRNSNFIKSFSLSPEDNIQEVIIKDADDNFHRNVYLVAQPTDNDQIIELLIGETDESVMEKTNGVVEFSQWNLADSDTTDSNVFSVETEFFDIKLDD